MISTRQQKLKKGFTLIETLVAILILMLAITGPLSLYSRFITQADELQHTYTGYYLAEEGYFAMSQKLHANMLSGGDMLAGLSGCDATSSGCAMNYNGIIVNTNCSSSNEARCDLFQELGSGRYTHLSTGGNKPTVFRRIVSYRIISTEDPAVYCAGFGGPTPATSYKEIQIVSHVKWLEDSGWRDAYLSRSIFDPLGPSQRCI